MARATDTPSGPKLAFPGLPGTGVAIPAHDRQEHEAFRGRIALTLVVLPGLPLVRRLVRGEHAGLGGGVVALGGLRCAGSSAYQRGRKQREGACPSMAGSLAPLTCLNRPYRRSLRSLGTSLDGLAPPLTKDVASSKVCEARRGWERGGKLAGQHAARIPRHPEAARSAHASRARAQPAQGHGQPRQPHGDGCSGGGHAFSVSCGQYPRCGRKQPAWNGTDLTSVLAKPSRGALERRPIHARARVRELPSRRRMQGQHHTQTPALGCDARARPSVEHDDCAWRRYGQIECSLLRWARAHTMQRAHAWPGRRMSPTGTATSPPDLGLRPAERPGPR